MDESLEFCEIKFQIRLTKKRKKSNKTNEFSITLPIWQITQTGVHGIYIKIASWPEDSYQTVQMDWQITARFQDFPAHLLFLWAYKCSTDVGLGEHVPFFFGVNVKNHYIYQNDHVSNCK